MKKWSIRIGVSLGILMFMFVFMTWTKAVSAGTDTQLTAIINGILDAYGMTLDCFIDVLKEIW